MKIDTTLPGYIGIKFSDSHDKKQFVQVEMIARFAYSRTKRFVCLYMATGGPYLTAYHSLYEVKMAILDVRGMENWKARLKVISASMQQLEEE